MKSPIGATITKRRKERGLTKTELAHKANLSRASITKYENGTRNPKLPAARKIADALKIPVYEILNEHEREMMTVCDPESSPYQDRYARAGDYLRSEASDNCRTAVFATLKIDGFAE